MWATRIEITAPMPTKRENEGRDAVTRATALRNAGLAPTDTINKSTAHWHNRLMAE